MSKELLNYVKHNLAKKYSAGSIRKALQKSGYKKAEIDEAFKESKKFYKQDRSWSEKVSQEQKWLRFVAWVLVIGLVFRIISFLLGLFASSTSHNLLGFIGSFGFVDNIIAIILIYLIVNALFSYEKKALRYCYIYLGYTLLTGIIGFLLEEESFMEFLFITPIYILLLLFIFWLFVYRNRAGLVN